MCKWPQSTSDSLTSCAVCGRCCNERGPSDQNGVAGELKRTAPAGNARLFRTGRATGGERNPQLRAVPAGVGRTGVRGPATEPHREVAARVGATAGEDVGQLRPEALTGQGGATAEGAVRRKLLGPQGEPAAVWESRSGQEPLAVRPGPGTDHARAQDEVHELRHAGARVVGGQAGSAVEQRDQEAG